MDNYKPIKNSEMYQLVKVEIGQFNIKLLFTFEPESNTSFSATEYSPEMITAKLDLIEMIKSDGFWAAWNLVDSGINGKSSEIIKGLSYAEILNLAGYGYVPYLKMSEKQFADTLLYLKPGKYLIKLLENGDEIF